MYLYTQSSKRIIARGVLRMKKAAASCKVLNEYGQIAINREVIAKIAGTAAMECYGIVGMAAKSVKDGIARLLKRESLTKGILIQNQKAGLVLDIHVILLYGTNIPVICESLINTVKYKVEEASGLKVAAVNIYVDGLDTRN